MAFDSSKRKGDDGLGFNEDLLAWAVRHCSDIHQNRVIVKSIISKAIDQFGRSARKNARKDSIALQKRNHRNRVSPGEFPEFQRCIFDCSRDYEILQETEHREGRLELTQEKMIPRVIEEILLFGYPNSFRMTVGVSQILHDYNPDETMRIYECLVQYTRSEKQLWDIRRQKSNAMDRLDGRFGDLLIKDDNSKRERKYKRLDQQRYEDVVEDWLNRVKPLRPSETAQFCISPPADFFRPHPHLLIPELHFAGNDPNDEQPFEMLRMHILLHTDCFSNLTKKLGLDPPRQRRNLPAFNLCKLEVAETCC